MKKNFILLFLLLGFVGCTCCVGGYRLTFFPKYDYEVREKELKGTTIVYNQENRHNDPWPMSKWVLSDIVTWEKE